MSAGKVVNSLYCRGLTLCNMRFEVGESVGNSGKRRQSNHTRTGGEGCNQFTFDARNVSAHVILHPCVCFLTNTKNVSSMNETQQMI